MYSSCPGAGWALDLQRSHSVPCLQLPAEADDRQDSGETKKARVKTELADDTRGPMAADSQPQQKQCV